MKPARTRRCALFLLGCFHLIGLVAGLLGMSIAVNAAAETGAQPKVIDRKFFGLHIHHLNTPYPNGRRSAWPSVPFGTLRMHGTYTTWYDLEPVKGRWDFSKLDHYVDMATKNGVEVLYTLGRTPRWASARPTEPCFPGHVATYGCAAEPLDMKDWANYVRTVATRYKGRISAYEIWNEPGFSEIERPMEGGKPVQFFTGSGAKMLEMAEIAYKVLKEVDPSIIVASPGITNYRNGLRRLEEYLKIGGGRWADVIAFHFYASPPEATVALMSSVQTLRDKYGLSKKPIWNTEMGYVFERADLGILPKAPKGNFQDVLDPWTGAAYVSRALILGAGGGMERLYWFNWDGEPPHMTMGLAASAGHTPTIVSGAYKRMYEWLVGSRVSGCARDAGGVWSCTIEQGPRKGMLIWTEKGETQLDPGSFPAVAYEQVIDSDMQINRGQKISVGILPVLLKAEAAPWKK